MTPGQPWTPKYNCPKPLSERQRLLGELSMTYPSRKCIDIVRRLAEGETVKEVALSLGCSPKNIEYHKAEAMRRLRLPNMILLTHYMLKHGLAHWKV